MSQHRIYKNGRSTDGWTRMKRVRKIEDIKVGSVYVAVSDQFKAENLVKIVRLPKGFIPSKDRKYFVYAKPSGRACGKGDGNQGSTMCLWYFELDHHRFFEAVKKA